MIPQIKKLVKDNESDIILIIGVVLIALISFGAGRITVPESVEKSIIFNEAPASVSEIVTEEQGADEVIYQGKFLGSKNSDKYHWPTCQWAIRISEENQVWFNSEEEAQAGGYIRCGSFEKNAP